MSPTNIDNDFDVLNELFNDGYGLHRDERGNRFAVREAQTPVSSETA